MSTVAAAGPDRRVLVGRIVCGSLAFLLAVLVSSLLNLRPGITLIGKTHPATLRATCASVLEAGLVNGSDFTDSDDKVTHFSYQIETDSTYTTSPQADLFAEVDCGRIRTRYTAVSAVLVAPIVLLALFACRSRRTEREIADLTEQLVTLRRRLDDQADQADRTAG